MTDYEMEAEPRTYVVTGSPAGLSTAFSVEEWQFFAFVFAAFSALALSIVDELELEPTIARVSLKIGVFALLGYFVLFNRTVKGLVVRVLTAMKTKEDR